VKIETPIAMDEKITVKKSAIMLITLNLDSVTVKANGGVVSGDLKCSATALPALRIPGLREIVSGCDVNVYSNHFSLLSLYHYFLLKLLYHTVQEFIPHCVT
jgi:hypothetical protein